MMLLPAAIQPICEICGYHRRHPQHKGCSRILQVLHANDPNPKSPAYSARPDPRPYRINGNPQCSNRSRRAG